MQVFKCYRFHGGEVQRKSFFFFFFTNWHYSQCSELSESATLSEKPENQILSDVEFGSVRRKTYSVVKKKVSLLIQEGTFKGKIEERTNTCLKEMQLIAEQEFPLYIIFSFFILYLSLSLSLSLCICSSPNNPVSGQVNRIYTTFFEKKDFC